MKFLAAKNKALVKAEIKTRSQKIINKKTKNFNGSRIVIYDKGYKILTIQKRQAKKLKLLNVKTPNITKKFVKQQARKAYIFFICQLKAAFNYLLAA